MTLKYLILLFISATIITSCSENKQIKNSNKHDPCVNGHDTTFTMQFTKDTTTTDFYKLIDFIQSKGVFEGFKKKDCEIGDKILLQKLLCQTKYLDSPKEYWNLENIFSISYQLTSSKPVIQANEKYYPKIYLTQFNFHSQKEKEIAYAKIKEIGWGDPLHKWNDYYIATSKTRIYLLEAGAAIFSEIKDKYGDIIQKEWIDKSNR